MRNNMSKYLVPVVLAIVILTMWSIAASASITTPLTRDSANPHYFINNGQHVIFLGAGQIFASDISGSYTSTVDSMASHNVNYARIWAFCVWAANEEMFPWPRTGGGTANDGKGKYDLSQWDSSYWSKLDGACAYAQGKNMYVSIPLFDRCGIDRSSGSTDHRWNWNPYNPQNNINGLSLPTDTGIPAFYDLTNAKLLQIQEAYVAKLISVTSKYPNVVYEVCNEYTGGTWAWEQHWIDFVKARCSNLMSINHLGVAGNTSASNAAYSGVDFVRFHVLDSTSSTTASYLSSTYSWNKPIDIDETPETTGITFTNYRNMMWGAFTTGGQMHIENGANEADSLTTCQYIWSYINTNGVQYWNMAPNNSLVTKSPGGTAYCLANPGVEYTVYVQGSGSGSMTMNLPSGNTYTAKAYNPSNGSYTTLSVSGNTISGIPSYSTDIVIYVKGTGGGTSSSPSVSVTMSADKTTATPGTTITYTLTYKNTGAGGASNVTISTPVSSSTSYVSGSGGTYNSTNRTVTWTLSSVAAGASGSVTYKVTVN